jgi:hypothetical protein
MFYYSNLSRAKDSENSGDLVKVLPDVEVLSRKPQQEIDELGETLFLYEDGEIMEDGWFWWFRFAECPPHDFPRGPFVSEKGAKEDMLQHVEGAIEA